MSKAAAGGQTGEGIRFHVNFNAITSYAKDILQMVDKNTAEIFPEESAAADFKEGKAQMESLIKACGDFDSMTWTSRKESGIVYSSIHIKTK
jgi:hypothetical protein